jgi:outer membrane lipoprotein LolB
VTGATRRFVTAALLILAALTAGCAGVPRTPEPVPPPPEGSAPPDAWEASGRIGIVAGAQAGSAQLRWRQSGSASLVSLRGPLGVGALEIESDGTGLVVTDAGGRRVDAEAAQALLEARLGLALPIAELRWWMVGLAAPGSPAVVEDAAQSPLRTIEQSGWRVGYDGFVRSAGHVLPARIEAERGSVRLKAVIDRWVVGDGSGAGP